MTKVAFIVTSKSKGLVGVFKRCQQAIGMYGYELSFYTDSDAPSVSEADLFIIDGYVASKFLHRYRSKPIVILEKADSASVFFRNLVIDERVDGMIKVSKLLEPFENYKNYKAEEILIGGKKDAKEKVVEISEKDLKKIACGPSFFAYNAVESWQHLDDVFDNKKHIDVHCICSTENYNEPIKQMRRKAIQIIERMKVSSFVGEGRLFDNRVYREQVCDSKIVVAPWGNGFSSYRMAEAMLAGCVLITPYCDFADLLGDPLRPYETFIPCKQDYSDLDEMIEYVLERWDTFEPMRKRNQQLARDLFSEYYNAEWFSEWASTLTGATV